VLPCRVPEKRNDGIDVFSPAGVLTVGERWVENFKRQSYRYAFEGSRLSVRLLLPPWELSQGNKGDEVIDFELELAVESRVKMPENGGNADVWVDQSLVRFVR